VKVCSEHGGVKGGGGGKENDLPLLQDPEVYAMLLQLYDGICEWEEDSGTPVLHVVWAKFLCFCLAKFEPWVREHVLVEGEVEEEEEEKEEVHEGRAAVMEVGGLDCVKRKKPGRIASKGSTESTTGKNGTEEKGAPVNGTNDEEKIKSAIHLLEIKVGGQSQNEAPNPNIAALAQACGESILNPEYLISGGEPFATQRSASPSNNTSLDTRVDVNEFLSSKSNGSPFPGMTMDSLLKADSPSDMMLCKDKSATNGTQTDNNKTDENENVDRVQERVERPHLKLHSAKMRGMKDLLTAAKLNSSAIKLQLTAQSQVSLKHSKVSSEYEGRFPRKRARRERE
jgi:menin